MTTGEGWGGNIGLWVGGVEQERVVHAYTKTLNIESYVGTMELLVQPAYT